MSINAKSEPINLRLSVATKLRLQWTADKYECSISDVVRRYIIEGLDADTAKHLQESGPADDCR